MVSFSSRQITVFAATFFCMVSRRASLEGWSILKPLVQANTGMASVWLGACDTMYMLLYAIGEFVNGCLSEKYAVHKVVAAGLLAASGALFALGALGGFGLWVPIVATGLWAIEGYAQSTVYPGCTKIMGQYFSHGIGKVMGLWTVNASTGNILGASLVTFCIGVCQFRWDAVLVVLASLMLLSGFLTLLLAAPDRELTEPLVPVPHMSFVEALQVKGIINYSLAYSCVKMMNYTVMMWLPLYMSYNGVGTSSVGIVMILYEIAGGIGSFGVGWITDRLKSRLLPLIVLVCVSIAPAIVLAVASETAVFAVCSAALGLSHIAISNMISGVVSIELGKKKVGLITGIIDGTASLAAGLGMFVIGVLQSYDWTFVWGFMVLVNVAALVPLILLKKTS